MKKSSLKSLIKFILKEVADQSPKLLDNWKEVSVAKHGGMKGCRGYFIMKNGKLADATIEFDGSSGLGGGVDHYGYALALNNRKLFGIPDELAQQALQYGEDSSAMMSVDTQHIYMDVWKHIERAISARVMIMPRTANTHMPNTTMEMFSETNPRRALRLAQGWVGKQIPDAPENMEMVIDLGHGDVYLAAKSVREFLSTQNPRDLMNH